MGLVGSVQLRYEGLDVNCPRPERSCEESFTFVSQFADCGVTRLGAVT